VNLGNSHKIKYDCGTLMVSKGTAAAVEHNWSSVHTSASTSLTAALLLTCTKLDEGDFWGKLL